MRKKGKEILFVNKFNPKITWNPLFRELYLKNYSKESHLQIQDCQKFKANYFT